MHQDEPPLPAAALAALQKGDTIGAIKLLRESHGLGLKEAKDVVDRHQAGQTDIFATPGPAEMGHMPDEVLAALQEGNVIEAIKRLRAARGLGLKEAKDAVDAHLALHPPMARQGAIISRDDGRRGWVWAAVAALAAAGAWFFFKA